MARWSSDVLSAANSQVTAHISLCACRILLKAQLIILIIIFFSIVHVWFSSSIKIQQLFKHSIWVTFSLFSPRFFRTCGLVYVFAHRVVFEENRAVLVVDVDQAGDHHKDQEAEDCNHNHLRTIRDGDSKMDGKIWRIINK